MPELLLDRRPTSIAEPCPASTPVGRYAVGVCASRPTRPGVEEIIAVMRAAGETLTAAAFAA